MTEFVDLSNVKPGDLVRRVMAETVHMDLLVVHVDERLIYCAVKGSTIGEPAPENMGSVWTFDKETGVEEDEDLGWGLATRISGSRLTHVL